MGHPVGLFVLFFTEMWERFSYYGMRAIFVANLTGGIIGGEIDRISEATSMSTFFMIFVISSFVAALLLVLLNKPLKRRMHRLN